MKKKSGLFVRINYKVDLTSKRSSNKDNNLHNSNYTKYLVCAGVYNKDGGTMIFQARDIDEAKDIINNNPFSDTPMYSYEILSKDNISLTMM
ncbi:hypothetical protein KQI89_10515 [Clostridium sp. MSJ-4]|uniref:YCII-related domain-containing protein n=1 Tax=Clostridium simiarum TaxID=2841506 RepID=A0ABS6F2U8_9CLOT|nr:MULTISPECIES: hypothetical protein [Clostridium]MBU5592194.1 hypothetical protein [Clostridium simiarum]